jgi:hypothetical protein
MQDVIRAFLATPAYYGCLLLVHPEVHRLEAAADEVIAAYGWPRLSVGRELSAVLLAEPPSRRSRKAQEWMESRLAQMAGGPVLCTETDLLFEPTLELDPLMLLRQVSRTTRLVATWAGRYSEDVLSYALPEHQHYRTWRQPEVAVLSL